MGKSVGSCEQVTMMFGLHLLIQCSASRYNQIASSCMNFCGYLSFKKLATKFLASATVEEFSKSKVSQAGSNKDCFAQMKCFYLNRKRFWAWFFFHTIGWVIANWNKWRWLWIFFLLRSLFHFDSFSLRHWLCWRENCRNSKEGQAAWVWSISYWYISNSSGQ